MLPTLYPRYSVITEVSLHKHMKHDPSHMGFVKSLTRTAILFLQAFCLFFIGDLLIAERCYAFAYLPIPILKILLDQPALVQFSQSEFFDISMSKQKAILPTRGLFSKTPKNLLTCFSLAALFCGS